MLHSSSVSIVNFEQVNVCWVFLEIGRFFAVAFKLVRPQIRKKMFVNVIRDVLLNLKFNLINLIYCLSLK